MGPSNAKIDRLTPFQLKHPVLSLLPMPGVAMDAHEGQADRTGATEVQLYCVQTQAIQIYHIKPEDCLAPSRSPSVSSPPPTLATPASVASKSPTVDNEAAAKKTSTSPAPTPSAEQPAILRMLLQVSTRRRKMRYLPLIALYVFMHSFTHLIYIIFHRTGKPSSW